MLIQMYYLGPPDYVMTSLFVGMFAFFSIMYSFMVIPPSIRRLHDINFSGWHLLWIFTLYLPVIILYVAPGTKGDNRFGSNPLAAK